LTKLQGFVLRAQTQRDVLCNIVIFSVFRILLGRLNKGGCEGQEDMKKNVKCKKLRQCVCCGTIMHPGQKKYGQIFEIRRLRPEIISKILDRTYFCGYTQFLEGFYF